MKVLFYNANPHSNFDCSCPKKWKQTMSVSQNRTEGILLNKSSRAIAT